MGGGVGRRGGRWSRSERSWHSLGTCRSVNGPTVTGAETVRGEQQFR